MYPSSRSGSTKRGPSVMAIDSVSNSSIGNECGTPNTTIKSKSLSFKYSLAILPVIGYSSSPPVI